MEISLNPSNPEYPRRILFVCTGNTCRSPMAEGIMKHRLPDEWKDKIHVESAGTMRYSGYPASGLAVRACSEKGIDISGHLSRELTEKIVADADIILVMEIRHLESVRVLGGGDRAFLITAYPDDTGREKEIQDPIGMDPEIYKEVFEELEREIEKVIRYVTLES